MSKHTPGPWATKIENADSGEIEVISERRPYVCTVTPGAIEGMTEANARLIAAAPELLNELVLILEWAQIEKAPLGKLEMERIAALIAKATGAQA